MHFLRISKPFKPEVLFKTSWLYRVFYYWNILKIIFNSNFTFYSLFFSRTEQVSWFNNILTKAIYLYSFIRFLSVTVTTNIGEINSSKMNKERLERAWPALWKGQMPKVSPEVRISPPPLKSLPSAKIMLRGRFMLKCGNAFFKYLPLFSF